MPNEYEGDLDPQVREAARETVEERWVPMEEERAIARFQRNGEGPVAVYHFHYQPDPEIPF